MPDKLTRTINIYQSFMVHHDAAHETTPFLEHVPRPSSAILHLDHSHHDDVLVQLHPKSEHRNNSWKTYLLLVGSMEGAGVLGLGGAMRRTGYFGTVLIVVMAILTTIQGLFLGQVCAKMSQEGFHSTFPNITEKILGKRWRFALQFLMDFTLIGVCIALIDLGGANLHILFPHISRTTGMVISAILITPVTWLRTPSDFWASALIAVVATTTAVIVLYIDMWLLPNKKVEQELQQAPKQPINFFTFSAAFGIIMFSFGGIPSFPVIQIEMTNPSMFSKPVIYTFLTLCAVYIPVAITSYYLFGAATPDNLLVVLPADTVGKAIVVALTLHILFAFVIILNPVSQHMEDFYFERYPTSPKKTTSIIILSRTLTVAFCLMIASLIPSFAVALSVVGSATVPIISWTFPSLLHTQAFDEPKYVLYHKVVAAFGVIISIVATSGAIYEAATAGKS